MSLAKPSPASRPERDSGDYREAERLLLDAIDIQKGVKDADPGITGTLDHNLALVGSEQGEFEEARRLFESAQRIWEEAVRLEARARSIRRK